MICALRRSRSTLLLTGLLLEQLPIVCQLMARVAQQRRLPYPMVEKDIAEGRLRVVSPESTSEIDIIMAWRRDSMGEAKSWCRGKFPNFLAENNRLSTFTRCLIIILVPVSDLVQSGFRSAYPPGS